MKLSLSIPHILPAAACILLAACHSRMAYPPGGYPYPQNLTGRDTQLYRYPIRNKETCEDSMWDAETCADWRSIDEPNLSLRPMPTDVFRFVYGEATDQTIYIIRMMPAEMVIRIGGPTETLINLPDTNLLSPLERRLIRILERNYPIGDSSLHKNSKRQHYLDSLGKLYPQLYDPAYFISLHNKEYPHTKPWFVFTSRTIHLKPAEFQRLVDTIDHAGYWHFPYDISCRGQVTDGWAYSLEANTAFQYNFVTGGGCVPDTSRFAKACQALVDFAGLGKRIHLVWDSAAAARPFTVEDAQLEDVREPQPAKHKKVGPRKAVKKPRPN